MKKFIKHLGVFILIIILVNLIFGYFYERPDRQAILNKTHWKYLQYNNIHNPNNKYEIIFLGSSRGYCAYNPQVFDSIIHTNSYNMCTGSQNIIESYYLLKEILRFQKPKIIVYEIFLPSFDKTTDYYHVLSNASFMSTKGGLDMIINGFGIEGVINYFLPILKHKANLKENISNFSFFKNKTINSNVKKNQFIKGFISDSKIVDSIAIKKFTPIYLFQNTSVSDKRLNYYFKAFFELCRVNKIKLVCVTAPYPPSRLKISPSDTTSGFFKKICNNYNVQFFDFNYMTSMKYEYHDSDFSDYHHLNCTGAKKISTQLANLLSNTYTNNNNIISK